MLTHPDADHASGLRDILEQMRVDVLLTCVPWEHAHDVLPIIQKTDSRVAAQSLERCLRDTFPAAVEAIEFAREKGVKVVEPVIQNGSLTKTTHMYLLGPTPEAYLTRWLPNYDCLPTQPSSNMGILGALAEKVAKALKWVSETWDKELLLDPNLDEVSEENNASIIFAGTQGDHRFLFCGDAGVPALAEAVILGNKLGLPIPGFTFFHVPHHGSRHNLGPSMLNALFGRPLLPREAKRRVTAYVRPLRETTSIRHDELLTH